MPARASNLVKVKQRQSFPIFESIGSAAAMVGCPEALIKTAKRQGCKAFLSGGRVDSGVLIPFLFGMVAKGSDLPDGFSSWKEVLESEKAKREAIKRQQDEGSMMPTAEAVRQAGEAGGHTMSELERLCRELPPSLAGQDSVSVFKRLSSEVERIRKILTEKFNQIGKQQ